MLELAVLSEFLENHYEGWEKRWWKTLLISGKHSCIHSLIHPSVTRHWLHLGSCWPGTRVSAGHLQGEATRRLGAGVGSLWVIPGRGVWQHPWWDVCALVPWEPRTTPALRSDFISWCCSQPASKFQLFLWRGQFLKWRHTGLLRLQRPQPHPGTPGQETQEMPASFLMRTRTREPRAESWC